MLFGITDSPGRLVFQCLDTNSSKSAPSLFSAVPLGDIVSDVLQLVIGAPPNGLRMVSMEARALQKISEDDVQKEILRH